MMTCLRDVMRTRVVSVTPSENVSRAVECMASNNIGCVLILEGDRPEGIITERDIVRLVYRKTDLNSIPVSRAMTRKLLSISPDKTIQDAVQILDRNNIKKLPVVESGRMLGIVTMTDLLKALEDMEKDHAERLRKTIKDLHTTKITLQSRVVELEEKALKVSTRPTP